MAITEAERLAQALEHFCTNWDGSARHDRKTPLNGLLCCDLRQAAAELRRLSADAQRFQALQNMPAKDAQAFFWNYSSRKARAAAIDQAMKDTP